MTDHALMFERVRLNSMRSSLVSRNRVRMLVRAQRFPVRAHVRILHRLVWNFDARLFRKRLEIADKTKPYNWETHRYERYTPRRRKEKRFHPKD